MTGMAPSWFQWVESRQRATHDRLNNLEESLILLQRQQRRMLVVVIGVLIINGVLLYIE